MEENKYTKEQILKEMGINEKLIRNEETNKALVKLLDNVSEVDLSKIQTEESFTQALQIYKQHIDVEKDGNFIFGIRKKEENVSWAEEIELLEDDTLYRNGNILETREEEGKSITNIKRQENILKLQEDAEDVLLSQKEKTKTTRQPNKEDITKEMMKNIREIETWDSEREVYNGWRNTKDVMHYDNQINSNPLEKQEQFRKNLSDSAQQDENVKLNPKIVTNKETLTRNILEQLGVSEKILEKPELVSQLNGIVDYANEDKNMETVEEVQGVIEKLKQTTQITENSISGIKANRKYNNVEKYSYDVTENIRIDINEKGYSVENTKIGRGFQDENGSLEIRQQGQKAQYRENRIEPSKLELEELGQKDVRVNKDIGQEINKGEQRAYLENTIPTEYGEMGEMFSNVLYKTIWKDDRTLEQQRTEDMLSIQDQREELKNQEQRE